MEKKQNKGVYCMAWGIGAGIVVIAAALGMFAPYRTQEEKREEERAVERLAVKARVEEEQKKVFSGLDLKSAFEAEAERLLTEEPAPVQDAVQRARPRPLISDK